MNQRSATRIDDLQPRFRLFQGLTLAILKSFSTPLLFPPAIHLLLICVDRV